MLATRSFFTAEAACRPAVLAGVSRHARVRMRVLTSMRARRGGVQALQDMELSYKASSAHPPDTALDLQKVPFLSPCLNTLNTSPAPALRTSTSSTSYLYRLSLLSSASSNPL